MTSYYKTEDLLKFGEIGKEAPGLAKKFFEYYNEVFLEGELTAREKSLIALAVAHEQRANRPGMERVLEELRCVPRPGRYSGSALRDGHRERRRDQRLPVAADRSVRRR